MLFWCLQGLQILTAVSLFRSTWRAVRRRGESLARYPFPMVLCGYSAACAVSNLLRLMVNDRTALTILSPFEYTEATLWWIASVWAATRIYGRVAFSRPPAAAPVESSGEREA